MQFGKALACFLAPLSVTLVPISCRTSRFFSPFRCVAPTIGRLHEMGRTRFASAEVPYFVEKPWIRRCLGQF